jgi:quaternary ammonium compound-resistance protein SugE
MAWISLIVAGVFEIGWPLGLKNGWTSEGARPGWIIFAIICMGISGVLLLYAQRTIPIGTAYAIWTGIGAVGTFFVGVYLFGDAMTTIRLVAVVLIVAGIAGLKFG